MSLKLDENLRDLPKGRLIVAVSGGVDSVVLLDILASDLSKRPDLIVAHADHGIRESSDWDKRFVEGLAEKYGVKFVSTKLSLGEKTSEAKAREARYDFLEEIRLAHEATAIVTAHHQDDVLETMIMNLLRGTGRLGLSSLRSRQSIIRPLISTSKAEIYAYAALNRLEFVEDETNSTRAYQRNRVRLEILPWLRRKDSEVGEKLLKIYFKMKDLNDEIDSQLSELLPGVIQNFQINRKVFAELPSNIRREVILTFLRKLELNLAEIDRGSVERTEAFILTALPGKKFNPTKQIHFLAGRDTVEIKIIQS